MMIQKFVAKDANTALAKVKATLGEDAVIVSQRKVRRGGIKGFFTPKITEITAANNSSVKPRQSALSPYDMSYGREKDELVEKALYELSRKRTSAIDQREVRSNQTQRVEQNREYASLVKEIEEMKDLITDIKAPKEDENKEILAWLKELDLEDEVINKLLNDVNETADINTKKLQIKSKFKELINVEPTMDDNIIVLVGPTGVGKTTTIAKLAGKYSLFENKKVGLITIDTYRIGAVDQLRTYSDIMNLEFRVVYSIKEVEEAIESLKDCDVILVDTTGRSSKNTMQISELRAFIDKTGSSCVNLVVSATSKTNDIPKIINGYKSLNFNGVIITKMDETFSYGNVLSIVNKAAVPLKYITYGQNVPDDIKVSEKDELIDLIVGDKQL